MDEKSKLRLRLRNARRGVVIQTLKQWDEQILSKLKTQIDWKNLKNVHIYLSKEEWSEVDTWALIKFIWQNYPKITLAAPRIHGKEMDSLVLTPNAPLEKNPAGITEPTAGKILPKNYQYDLIIVPTLGFNNSGYRLGSGSGHYDRFLENHTNSTLVGLCYEIGYLEKGFKHEPHDIKMNQIITEKDIYNF